MAGFQLHLKAAAQAYLNRLINNNNWEESINFGFVLLPCKIFHFFLHTCHLQCTSTSSKAIAFRAERLAVTRPAKHFLFYGETTAPDVWGPDLLAILESFIAQVCTIQRLKRVTKVATLHTESD
jgi:hypothetical protein